MKKYFQVITAFLSICLILTSCAPIENGKQEYSQEVQNLEKLCKVWGYVKYNHPAFLLGEKDWDEELLNLIPVVSKAKDDEVNDILHEWFVSLGEIDYQSTRKRNLPPEEQMIVQPNNDWICEDYLGTELIEDFVQLGEIPNIDRDESPVLFQENGVPQFINEKLYKEMNYKDLSYRLLGLFRFWNAVEYYFPYLNLMDESWELLLPDYIQKMININDKTGYELTILSFAAKMNDAHTYLLNGETNILTLGKDDTQMKLLIEEFGDNFLPVKLMTVENQPVVAAVGKEDCSFMIGDIILKLNDVNINEVIQQRKEYIPIPNEEKQARIYPYLLTSKSKEMEVTILRNGKEKTVSATGSIENYSFCYLTPEYQKQESFLYQISEDNIGIINLKNSPERGIKEMMRDLEDTDGLIIDLRQGVNPNLGIDLVNLCQYFCEDYQTAAQLIKPTQSFPGSYVSDFIMSGSTDSERKISGKYYYSNPVMILTDETVVSSEEYAIMLMRTGKNVIVMGGETLGADGNIAYLPLPGNLQITFSSLGIYGPNKEQVQRTGLTPDIEVHPTIEGIREGRDELMEAAVKYIKEQ